MGTIAEIVDDVRRSQDISYDQFVELMTLEDKADIEYLRQTARAVADSVYGKNVYVRGLIEFTNYCKNDCYYCGIRHSNRGADRYRLTDEQIMEHPYQCFLPDSGKYPLP